MLLSSSQRCREFSLKPSPKVKKLDRFEKARLAATTSLFGFRPLVGLRIARRSGAISVIASGRFPRTGLRDNLPEGGLADRLLLTITYGMAISRHLSGGAAGR